MIEAAAIASIIFYTLRNAAPLMLAAVGGTFTERTGIINIALEGIMITGAFFAAAMTMTSHAWLLENAPALAPHAAWFGVISSIFMGAVMAWLHAVVSIKFKANQVVSGVAINLLAVGLSSFLMRAVYDSGGQLVLGTAPRLPVWSLNRFFALFEWVPVVGDWLNSPPFLQAVANHSPGIYIAFIVVFVAQVVLFKTPLGLRIRAVGEHPKAADTLGVNVHRTRYLGVILSGVLAGFAGSVLTISHGMSGFVVGMVAGRGFIALAAMIFGKWTPLGAMGACLLFGFTDAVRVTTSIVFRAVPFMAAIPAQLFALLPYVVTMLALAGIVGRSTPPVSIGIPYDTEE